MSTAAAVVRRQVLLDLCDALGLNPRDVKTMRIAPREIEAEVVVRNPRGKMVLDGSGLDVEFQTITFEVSNR